MIRSLNQQGVVEEAVGHVAEIVDKGAPRVLVVHVDEEGYIKAQAFGDVTFMDLAYFSSFLDLRVKESMQ